MEAGRQSSTRLIRIHQRLFQGLLQDPRLLLSQLRDLLLLQSLFQDPHLLRGQSMLWPR